MTNPTLQEVLGIQIDIGVEAQKFLESELGLAVLSRQRAEIADLHARLEKFELSSGEILQTQMNICARRKAVDWLIECINEAKIAYQQLEQSETED